MEQVIHSCDASQSISNVMPHLFASEVSLVSCCSVSGDNNRDVMYSFGRWTTQELEKLGSLLH